MKIKLIYALLLFGYCFNYAHGLTGYNSLMDSIPSTQYKNISDTIMSELMKMDIQKIMKTLDIQPSTVNEIMANGDLKTIMNAIVSNSLIKELFLKNSSRSSLTGFFPPEGLSANCTVAVFQLAAPLMNITDKAKIIAVLLKIPLGRSESKYMYLYQG